MQMVIKWKKFNRPNDLTFDMNGNLFFTDPKSYDKNILDGRIFLVDAKTKEVILLGRQFSFSKWNKYFTD